MVTKAKSGASNSDNAPPVKTRKLTEEQRQAEVTLAFVRRLDAIIDDRQSLEADRAAALASLADDMAPHAYGTRADTLRWAAVRLCSDHRGAYQAALRALDVVSTELERSASGILSRNDMTADHPDAIQPYTAPPRDNPFRTFERDYNPRGRNDGRPSFGHPIESIR